MSETSSPKILFFSRGRGRGHAMPDSAIVRECERQWPEGKIRFASYGTGARTLTELGHTVDDLDLDDENPFVETLIRATRLIDSVRPNLVVSHEEFAALPAAKVYNLPTVFITDWLLGQDYLINACLGYADRVLFVEERGLFPELEVVKGRVEYLGPIARPMQYTVEDRRRARNELDVPQETVLLSVIPGAWANERRAPAFDLICSAVQFIASTTIKVVWVAGTDYDELSVRGSGHSWLELHRSYSPIERLMAASNLVITKGNRGTTLDAAACGVRTLALTEGSNPIDELIVRRVPSNESLWISALDGPYLARRIIDAVNLTNQAVEARWQASQNEESSNLPAVVRSLRRVWDAEQTRSQSCI